jgi:hypothetical protein
MRQVLLLCWWEVCLYFPLREPLRDKERKVNRWGCQAMVKRSLQVIPHFESTSEDYARLPVASAASDILKRIVVLMRECYDVDEERLWLNVKVLTRKVGG